MLIQPWHLHNCRHALISLHGPAGPWWNKFFRVGPKYVPGGTNFRGVQIKRDTPMACTQHGDCMLNLNTRWLQNSTKEPLPSLLATFCSSKQMISLTGHICEGCCLRLASNGKAVTSALHSAMGRKVDIYACKTLVVWPPRSIAFTQKWSQKQSHSLKFSGGACPQTPLPVAYLHNHLYLDSLSTL